jgi:uncharacterized protein (TIGR02996 family)
MTIESALLRAIATNIDDDTPRLIYADWLEADKPDSTQIDRARAEFIRLSIQLGREGGQLPKEAREPLEKRRFQLEHTYNRAWEENLRSALGDNLLLTGYERGFLSGIDVTGPDRLVASQLLSSPTSTLRSLTVNFDSDDQIPALTSQLAHTQITNLHFRFYPVGYEYATPGMRPLSDAVVEQISRLHNVRSLILDGDGITAAGAGLLAERMPNLEQLMIDGNPIGDEGARRIATMSNLRSLGLNGCGITAAGAEAIAGSQTLPFTAKVTGLETAGFPDMAAELARTETPTAGAPQVEWFRTNWRGHPGEVLFRTPVGEFTPAQLSALREQVIQTLIHDGFSRDSAEGRVVVRHSEEMGQDSLTVVGNAASIALMKAVERGQHLGVCHSESHWREKAGGGGQTLGRPSGGRV